MSTDDSPERDFHVYDRDSRFPRTTLKDAEGTSNVSESEDISNPSNSTGKPKSYPRREVWWLDLGAKNQSLESIKDYLDRFLSSSSNSRLRHITSPKESKLRHNLHKCPGYLREEITLASDVSKSLIVSHAFPGQSEVCSVCGQLVQYNFVTKKCEICHKKNHCEEMLLCDGCDCGEFVNRMRLMKTSSMHTGFHTFCLDPPLDTIPKGQWFCFTCLYGTGGDFGFDEGEEHSLSSFEALDKEF